MSGPVILIVDDEEGLRYGLKTTLEKDGFTVMDTGDPEEAMRMSDAQIPDIAVLDVRLGSGISGIDLMESLREKHGPFAVIMITGYGTVDTAVEAMKKGADDYVLKPIENHRLRTAVGTCLELNSLRSENRFLKETIRNTKGSEIITNDRVMLELLATADRVKQAAPNILISGESGVGKEMVARYIHYTGPRREAAFVSVNCAVLSENLLLSNLFGHEKGAFTDAREKRIGKFEMADKGTLFLDEIGEMSPAAQAKLLHVIEERRFERLGGSRSLEVDIQLIAATNRELSAMVQKGDFREDLFYRLNVIALHIPPLKSRLDDIVPLAEHFIRHFALSYRKHPPSLSDDAVSLLNEYSWPGNVRELSNTINRAVLLSHDTILNPHDLSVGNGFVRTNSGEGPLPDAEGTLGSRMAPLVAYWENRIIKEMLDRCGGNKTQAASKLGITRKTLHAKISR